MKAAYLPGTSWLHRLGAGPKLGALAVLMLPVMVFRTLPSLAVTALLTVALYRSAGLSWTTMGAQARPLRWVVVILIAGHVLLSGGSAWVPGVVVAGTIVVAVMLASLVTLTTPMSDMIDSIERWLEPLRRFGARPERVAMVFALTVRSIPIVAGFAADIRSAQRARGVSRSVRAYGVPLVVRSLRHADAMGEALVARGLDD